MTGRDQRWQHSSRCPNIFYALPNLMHLGEAINFRVLDEESAVIPLVRIAAVHFNAETKS
ncbi:hypothetical protein DKM48_27245 [Klebsiella pneumoniae]|nr:hypothetical protein BB747_29455 [Klebsiella pneumoniae]RUL41453.1 hypothetical protein ELP97_16620 [Klebsiella pneumoniae subsp. pneumoniae]APM79273.1 hypothetical protein BB748_29515 [Klebsiella pneumoniae]OWA95197.1 hypothetical protein BV377_23915 [Klebsiella pneumoniae]PWX99282.1 hypothetical protein DKM48_27245 [Klebsiella pneumoniae]